MGGPPAYGPAGPPGFSPPQPNITQPGVHPSDYGGSNSAFSFDYFNPNQLTTTDTHTKELQLTSGVQTAQDHLLDELNQRASSLPMEAIHDMPNTMGHLLFMPISTYGVQQIGDMLNKAYPWLKSQMGVSGSLSGAYANALQLQDPEQRKIALSMLQGLAASINQQMIPSQPYGGTAAPGQAISPYALQGRTQAQAQSEQAGVPWQAIEGPIKVQFDAQGNAVGAKVETANVQSPQFLGEVAMLRYLYPNIKISGTPSEALGKILGAADVVVGGIGKGFDAAGAFASSMPVLGAAISSGLHGLGTGANIAGSIKTLPFTESAILAGDITHFIPGLPGEKPQLTNPLMPLWPHEFMHGTALGEAWARALDIQPTDPTYQKMVDVGAFITQMAGFSAIGKGFANLKESGALAQVQAGVTEKLGLGPHAIGSAGTIAGDVGRASEVKLPSITEGIGGYGKYLTDKAAAAIYDVLSKTPDEFWNNSPLGRAAVNRAFRVLRENPTDAVGELGRAFGRAQVPEGLAKAWHDSSAQTPQELAATAIEYTRGTTDPAFVEGLRGERAQIDAALQHEPDPMTEAFGGVRPADDPMQRAAMVARKAQIDAVLADLPSAFSAPAWEFPKSSLARRINQNLPDNPAESALSWLWNPPTRWLPHANRLFDYVGNRFTLWNPFETDRPITQVALDQNAEELQIRGRRLGVPQAEIDRLISRQSEITTDQGFKEWTHDVERTVFGQAKYLYPRLAGRLLDNTGKGFSERALQGFWTKADDGSWTRKAVIPREVANDTGQMVPTDAPWMSSQLMGHYFGPSTQSLLDMTSTFQNFTQLLKDKGGGFASFADAVDWIRSATSRATAILRPLTLFPRFIAILLRSQGEQAARNYAKGYHAFTLPDRLGMGRSAATFGADGIPKAQDMQSLMGIITRNSSDSGPMLRSEIKTFSSPGMFDKRALTFTWQNFRDLAASGEMGQLVRIGSPEGYVRWLEGDTAAARMTRARFDPVLRSATDFTGDLNASRLQWGKRSLDTIHQLSGENDALRTSIIDGNWKRLKDPRFDTVSLHQDFNDLFQMRDRFHVLGDQITEARRVGNKALTDALRAERQDLQGQIVRFNNEAMGRGKASQFTYVNVFNQRQFEAALEDAYRKGEWVPPPRVSGLAEDITREDAARLARQDFNTRWYNSIGVAQKLDMYLSRGSYYYQRTAELAKELESRGYSQEDAVARAAVKGAQDTADLHYNLTTRTSAQRAFRNLFWFAPVMQDVLYKWLVEIPSTYTWPVGAAILADRAEAIVKLTRDLGLIHKDANGNPYVTIPFLGSFLHKFTGGKLPWLKDMVTGDPRRLNILGIGQGWKSLQPGLSPQFTIPLNFLAQHSRAINDIANVMEPYGLNDQVGPSALPYLWEAVTGKPFPMSQLFSDRYTRQQYDLAFDDAIKHAVAETGPPPNVGDKKYAHYTVGANVGNLTPAGQEAYQNDHDKWAHGVMIDAKKVYQGWAWIRLLGSTVSPMPLRATDSYKQDAARVVNQLYGTKPPDPSSPAYIIWAARQDAIRNHFLADHPNGMAYLVSKTVALKANLPYTKNDASAFFKQLETGARDTLSPRDFLTYLGYQESYRHYIGEKQNVIDSLGGTRDAILLHGYEYHRQMDPINNQWHQFEALNGDGVKLFQDRLRTFQKTGEVPSSTFETQRTSDVIGFLRDIANGEPSGGTDQQDIRKAMGAIERTLVRQYGPPRTQLEKQLNDYFTKVLDPFYKQTQPLWDKRDQMKAAGEDASAISGQIRELTNKMSAAAVAKGFPDPQAVSWGNKSPVQQRVAKILYGTYPVSWLTDFQRTQAGYKANAKTADQLFNAEGRIDAVITAIRNQYNAAAIAQGKAQMSSQAAQQLDKWRTTLLSAEAKKLGPEAQKLWQLEQATPAQRLIAVNKEFQGHPDFSAIVGLSQYVQQAITANKESPKGFARVAAFYKQWLFPILATLETKKADFHQLMEDASMALKGNPTGAPLYDQLFFDGFGKVPTELAQATQAIQGNANLSVQFKGGLQQWEQTYQNGQVPQNAMDSIGGNNYLAPFAASAYMNMVNAAKGAGITWSVDGAYRTLAEQQQLYQNYLNGTGNLAAAPGTSEHGWGIALDLGGADPGSAAWNWLQANAAAFGFQRTVPSESWHWAYVGG